jgi:CheY-like chemotaxis protein
MSTLKKIMVVDDDPVVATSLNRVLTGKGYAVITAKDGEEALDKLRSEKYDLVYTDIRMPGMNGLELAEHVKAHQPWLPVVIITGYGNAESEARAATAGVAGFLHKPLSPDVIEESADAALAAAARSHTEEVVKSVPATPEAAPRTAGQTVKNVALFFAAPFIGLAYVIAFPLVGLGMLAWMGGKAAMKSVRVRNGVAFAKRIGMFAAGPLLGLAFVLLLPWIGAAMLAWIGGRALMRKYPSD